MATKDHKQKDAPDATTVFERRLIFAATISLILTLTIPAVLSAS